MWRGRKREQVKEREKEERGRDKREVFSAEQC